MMKLTFRKHFFKNLLKFFTEKEFLVNYTIFFNKLGYKQPNSIWKKIKQLQLWPLEGMSSAFSKAQTRSLIQFWPRYWIRSLYIQKTPKTQTVVSVVSCRVVCCIILWFTVFTLTTIYTEPLMMALFIVLLSSSNDIKILV